MGVVRAPNNFRPNRHDLADGIVYLVTGIQYGPPAIAIIAFTFSGTEQQAINAVPVLYSLFIVIVATLVTLYFRRANTAAGFCQTDANRPLYGE